MIRPAPKPASPPSIEEKKSREDLKIVVLPKEVTPERREKALDEIARILLEVLKN